MEFLSDFLRFLRYGKLGKNLPGGKSGRTAFPPGISVGLHTPRHAALHILHKHDKFQTSSVPKCWREGSFMDSLIIVSVDELIKLTFVFQEDGMCIS
jgi:hypothetical protein